MSNFIVISNLNIIAQTLDFAADLFMITNLYVYLQIRDIGINAFKK